MQKAMGQAPGKLILSGEYAVVFGYPGIAIPSPFTVTATWDPSPSLAPARFTLSPREREIQHHDMTIRYRGIENENYLHRILDAITEITGPLHGDLTIENTIPVGRGMGSSTALVIAICRCLLSRDQSQSPLPAWRACLPVGRGTGEGLKNIALSIENAVNPGHSGLDFAVIWNGKPILFQKDKPAKVLNVTINRLMGTLSSPILLDTGNPNETTPEIVRWVKENSLSPRERVRVRGALQTIAHCTERLLTASGEICHPACRPKPWRRLEHNQKTLYKIFHDHHHAQVALGVVPKTIQKLIADIEQAGGAAKVVGAGGRTGGGGMVLALHSKPEKLLTIAKRHKMPTLTLTPQPTPLHSYPLKPNT